MPLIDNGTFKPRNYLTPFVKKYSEYKYGWLICWSNYTFGGYCQCEPASSFDVPYVDVKDWAIKAAEAGVEYAILTVCDPQGFLLYPSNEPLPAVTSAPWWPYTVPSVSPNYNGRMGQIPAYDTYHVPPGTDQFIVEKFFEEFRAVGIEPMIYVNPLVCSVCTGGKYIIDPNLNSSQKNAVIDYLCRICQEMIIRFNCKYMWFDLAAQEYPELIQRIYNACRSADPECVVIGNVMGEYNMERGPYDVESTEEYGVYSGNTAYQSRKRIFEGKPVLIPQEGCATTKRNSRYYFTLPGAPDHDYYGDTQTPPIILQDMVDNFHAFDSPVCIAMEIDNLGRIEPNLYQYILDHYDFGTLPPQLRADKISTVIAKQTISFEDAGFNVDNVRIIYEIGDPMLSWSPDRETNDIEGFTAGKSYNVYSKVYGSKRDLFETVTYSD